MEELRDKDLEDYKETAFRKELWPDPPLRGTYGMATIPLIKGAVPFTAKAFCMHGRRVEAYKKVMQDWLDRGFIERPDLTKPQEWLVQGLVVPKKNAEFPWRGVVDLRGPNEQTRKCNFLLPKIDDLLVKQGKCYLFSIIDLRTAFHQQPLDPESRPYMCTNNP